MCNVQLFELEDGVIFVLFFVLKESGGAKERNVLRKKCGKSIKCGLSNYLYGGGAEGGMGYFFIFRYFLLFVIFLLLLFTFEMGRGAWVLFFHFFIVCYFFIICKFLLFLFIVEKGSRA
jgi:hypothetical protein